MDGCPLLAVNVTMEAQVCALFTNMSLSTSLPSNCGRKTVLIHKDILALYRAYRELTSWLACNDTRKIMY